MKNHNKMNRLSLHDMRICSGTSGMSIADLCGTTYQTLRNWERGIAIPNIVNIYDLLQVYGYSFSQLDLSNLQKNGGSWEEKQKRLDAHNPSRQPIENPETFTTLQAMREESGYSRSTVVAICGFSYQTLRNWEKGTHIPNIVNVVDLIRVYGYAFNEIDMTPFMLAIGKRSDVPKVQEDMLVNFLKGRQRFAQL